ncbi:phospholipase A [Caenimonas aquaedulcis]|uniref:Phospholipase A1 n=1 Tax=Caenimonas aquaedulcis TaxID=2793270 RepID=A0A931H545_9BURK|nr:phospholipase A [Caenimonas aquaedulcis]MBG9388662.1 phospholipase A [Caenimonas aquaedulcis]
MRQDDQGNMAGRGRFAGAGVRAAQAAGLALTLAAAPGAVRAQDELPGWRACTALRDREQRLACFDGLAEKARALAPPSPPVAGDSREKDTPAKDCNTSGPPGLARFWELQENTSCGTYALRGYRPNSASLVVGSTVNDQPTSANPLNNATTSQPYRTVETRIQLSLRTKLFEGLLAHDAGEEAPRDSLWFGYTQQSYWQLFTPSISRPFRSTDHEPELMYVYPLAQALGQGWTLRYGGLGLVHQSNGQSLPYSRSWNRAYLMAGMEHAGGFTVQGRLWKRMHESAGSDDNPGISDYIGRGELTAAWNVNPNHAFIVTLRHPLNGTNRGSARVEWLQRLPTRSPSTLGNLRLHTQLFTGYGDSLLDYNRHRTVFTVGFSLVDW